MRIDKAIASQGAFSRKDVKQLLKSGRVRVNGTCVSDPATQVDEVSDVIEIDGQPINFKKHIYIMLNKPKGVVSATDDKVHKTVIDLVPDELKRNGLFPAGRLDGDTTGFVLITDDGEFAHNMLSPRHHVEKTYLVTLAEPLTDAMITKVSEGIELKDGAICLPASVEKIDDKTAYIRIVEGKYHQIKRMFAAAGNRVVELERTAIGGLQLDKTLALGECREINDNELHNVFVRS